MSFVLALTILLCLSAEIEQPKINIQGSLRSNRGTVCSVDQYVKDNKCTQCAAGSTRVAGDEAVGADTTCQGTVCSVDEYVKDNKCTQCAAGSTRVAGDEAVGADTTCQGTVCSVDHHVKDNKCTQCAAGFTRVAGDEAMGADTACQGPRRSKRSTTPTKSEDLDRERSKRSVRCMNACHRRGILHPAQCLYLC